MYLAPGTLPRTWHLTLARYVLVIFMEQDTEQEANLQDCSKAFKKVKFLKVDGAISAQFLAGG